MRSVVIVFMIMAIAGCTPEEEERPSAKNGATEAATAQAPTIATMQKFEIGDRSYAIPEEYIPAIRIDSRNSFVRIKFPDFSAEIVADERSSGKTDKTGAPQIFSINDRDYPRIDYSERADQIKVICRIGMMAQSGCGTLFEHAGTRWSLLFPLSRRDQADRLVEQAQDLLDRYADNPEVGPTDEYADHPGHK